MKLLLISYYFPPCGGAGVQRWLRLVNALSAKGVHITVLTTRNGDYPQIDPSLLERIPREVKVIRTRPLGFSWLWKALGQKELPYGSLNSSHKDSLLKKALYWLRINLVVPDIRRGWNPAAYRNAVRELATDRYEWIITTGPPHSTHLIGLRLKRRYGRKWLADFRDPMSQIYYLQFNPPIKPTQWLHRYYERQIVRSADLNLIVSHSIATGLPQGTKAVLYNGYDPEDFTGISYERADKFRIKYAGQLTAGQDPSPLIKALQTMPQDYQIDLITIGTRNFPSSGFPVHNIPYLPHHQALTELVNAELLLLVINDYPGNEGMLTTKLFEYIASRTPILCLGNAEGEAARLVRTTQSGIISTDTDAIADYINVLYTAWHQGDPRRCTGDISNLDVNHQAAELLAMLQGHS